MKARILLTSPAIETGVPLFSQLFPMPLGLASLGGFLKENGYNHIEGKDFIVPNTRHLISPPPSFKGKRTLFNHYGMSDEYVDHWCADNLDRFDVIAVSSMQINTAEDGACKLVKTIKNYTDAPVVVGGYSATTNPDWFFDNSGADYIIRGEGEQPFLKFLQILEAGDFPERRGVFNKIFDQIEDLDDLPFPAWELFPLEIYPKYKTFQRIVLTTSRGCPFDCRFCSVKLIMGNDHCSPTSPKWRRHSAEYTVKLIEHLYKRFEARYLCILDDNFLADTARATKILEGIENLHLKGAHFYIEEGIMVRQAFKNPELITKLAQLKFDNIALAVESLTEQTIQYIQKPETKEEIFSVTKNLKQQGIEPKIFYILGFKTDTLDSMLDNIMELATFKLQIRINNLHILPNTEIWNEYVTEKIIDPKTWDFRLSSFFTPPTKNFSFDDIMELRKILSGVNYGTENGVDVFHDSFREIRENLKDIDFHFGDRISVAPKSMYQRALSPLKRFLTILALRKGYSQISFRINGNRLDMVEAGKKTSNVENKLRDKFMTTKPTLLTFFSEEEETICD